MSWTREGNRWTHPVLPYVIERRTRHVVWEDGGMTITEYVVRNFRDGELGDEDLAILSELSGAMHWAEDRWRMLNGRR